VCIPQLISMLPPPTWVSFQECLANEYATINMSVVGAEAAVIADCWCQHNVTSLIEAYGCCDHPNFRMWCEMSCQPSCESAKAQECHQRCPGLCLERDYAPESCDCQSDGCPEYIRCIAWRAANRSASGQLASICDDTQFAESQELAAYEFCLTEQNMRTTWNRHNAIAHCTCKSGLQRILQTHSCCGADWAKSSCEIPCKDETVCNSTEAKQCLDQCRQTCRQLLPVARTQECDDLCFEGSCKEYRSCPPLDPLSHEYQCADGTAPESNGCCPSRSHHLGADCPALCSIKNQYVIWGGLQCQCFDCPVDDAEQIQTMKDAIEDNLVESGRAAMVDVCSQVRLNPCPSQGLQKMMSDRNKELADAIEAHQGMPDQEFQDSLEKKASNWNARILLEAHREESCSFGVEDACKELSTERDTKDREDSSGNGLLDVGALIAILLAVLVIGFLAGVLFFLFCRRIRKVPEASNPDMSPVDGDRQVVVGRPVAPEQSQKATTGAVVSTGEAAKPTPEV